MTYTSKNYYYYYILEISSCLKIINIYKFGSRMIIEPLSNICKSRDAARNGDF